MRYPLLAVSAGLFCGAYLLAQQPAAQPQPAAPQDPLNQILQNWERVMNGINSFVADCTRKDIDKAWQSTRVLEGKAKFLKPNMLSLELTNKANPQDFEKFVINGSEVYIWSPKTKVIRVNKLPQPKAGQQQQEDSFLQFLMGMKAADALKRYQLSLLPGTPQTEKWYWYIRVLPREARDKADFTQARLVLFKNNYMLAQIWYEQPNGNETTWDCTKLYQQQLPPQEFQRPVAPPGWQMVSGDLPGPAGSGPRVIRQQN
jgi:TIGR03009 family protein